MIKKLINKMLGHHPEAMSFMQGMDLTGIPIITLYQKENKYNFILDTGSTDCVIDSSVLDFIEHEKTDEKSNLHGMEGNKKTVDICSITLTYKNKDFTHNFLAGDLKKAFGEIKKATGVTLHGLLGSDFFNKYKYTIDFNELIAYSKA